MLFLIRLVFFCLETVVVPNQKPSVYYHRKFPRVPTVDECYEADAVCMFEANEQFKRDMYVLLLCIC